jgi:hypothetical protein
LTYAASLRTYFLSDDFLWLEGVSGYSSLSQAIAGIMGALGGMFYRPLPRFVFWTCYQLFGLEPAGYHWLNVLLHMLNSLLVYLFVRKVSSKKVAFVSGALFAVHYVHVESVAWISEFNGTLMALFAISTLILMARYHATGSAKIYMLALLTYAAALLSKEAAVAMLPVLVAFDVFLTRWRGLQQLVRLYAPFCALTIGYLFIQSTALRLAFSNHIELGYSFRVGTITLGSWLWYPLVMLVPVKFVALSQAFWQWAALVTHPFVSPAAFDPAALLPGAAWLFIAGLLQAGGMYLLWRGGTSKRFSVIWMIVTLIPVLFLSGNADRYAYLPSVGFALLAAGLLAEVFRQSRWMIAAVIFVLIIQGGVTQIHLADWLRASQSVRQIVADIKSTCPSFGEDDEVWYAALPDAYNGAYVFRNGIDAATRLICRNNQLHVRQVGGSEELPTHLTASQHALVYQSEHLVNLTSRLRDNQ